MHPHPSPHTAPRASSSDADPRTAPLDHDARLAELLADNAMLVQRCAQQAAQLSILGGVADGLAKSADIDAVFQSVLAACLDAGGISKGALFREDAHGEMAPVQSVGFSEDQRRALSEAFAGMSSLALLSVGKPLRLSTLLEGPEKEALATSAGVRAAILVPVLVDGHCRAALFLGGGEDDLREGELVAFGRAIGAYVGQAMALSSAFGRLGAAAEADRILFSSLDLGETLNALGRLAIATMADTCEIDVVRGEAMLEQAVTLHAEPAKLAVLSEMNRRYPPRPGISPRYKVLASGEPYLISEKTDAMRREIACDEEHLRMLREIGLRSHIVVPLVTKGRTLGVLSIGTSRAGRRYGAADLAVAQELAGRAAVSLENVRLYQEAQEASRAKDEFLATVSHELRTPLSAMLGWARLLRSGRLAEDRAERALASIERNALAQKQLVDEILDVSSIVAGKVRLAARETSLSSVVEEAVESVRLSIEAKELHLDVELDPSIVLACDPDRLRQVVWNLLSNAVKFTPRGGTISVVTVASAPSSVQLVVKDSGHGIRADFLPHVFERFQQADGSFARTSGGLGLGLAIARHIVELHGGTIQVESEGEGKGALFRIVLPCALPISTRSARVPPPPSVRRDLEPPPELSGLRCFVVEDDVDTQEVVRALLEECGAIVSIASSAPEALRRLAEGPHDVLISDIGLPAKDGMSLIRAVRERPADQGGAIPAVAVSGYARAADKSAALGAGFQLHLAKPFEPCQLVAAVASLAKQAKPSAKV